MLIPVGRLIIAGLVGTLVASGCREDTGRTTATVEGLGTLSFPVRTSSEEARQAFQRGVLLLHLFHYDEARAAFRAAQTADTGLVLAWWGEAMAWNYSVWNEQNADSARAALNRLAPTAAARRDLAPTPRDAALLDAVAVLYGNGPKARRDTLYHAAMVAASMAFPDDDEVTLFTALAMLGLNQGVRDVPTYLAAADLAEEVFRRRPDHPGASHYLIHGVDDPEHAARGLEAARRLALSSPDAGHGQHMTSHIFLALGMWEDVVTANQNAARVADAARTGAGRPPARCGHVNTWLNYGYLQLGRIEDARQLTRACIRAAHDAGLSAGYDPDPDNSLLASAVFNWSRFILESREWDGEDIGWDPGLDTSDTPAAVDLHFTRAFAALARGDLTAAQVATRAFERVRTASLARSRGDPDPGVLEYQRRLEVMHLELEGLTRIGAGRHDEGLETLRRAGVIEDQLAYAFGPPTGEPAAEATGVAALRLGHPDQAEFAFRVALDRNPGRRNAVQGLVAALSAQGRQAAADSAAGSLRR